ncbi:hypothetical protein GF354_00710 [Candidatus Peregrinibacteria bacterium]|nr:hypothetical protein [Candidatus Peregrinibacteria bacterium]
MNKKIKDFTKALTDALGLVKLDIHAVDRILKNKDTLMNGIIILVLPFLVNIILFSLSFPSGIGAIFSRFVFWPVIIPGLSIVGLIFFVAYFAKNVYKVKIEVNSFLGLMLYGSLVFWLLLLPVLLHVIGLNGLASLFNKLSLLLFLWYLLITYKVLGDHYKMDGQAALITVGAAGLVYFLLVETLGNLFVGGFYNFFYL